jgi:hypothetical protein
MKYAACLLILLAACGKKEEPDKRFPDPTAPYEVPKTYDEAFLEVERFTRDVNYYVENANMPKAKEQIEPLKKLASKLHELAKAKDISIDDQTFVGDASQQLAKAIDQLELGLNATDMAKMKSAIADLQKWGAELKKCYGHKH